MGPLPTSSSLSMSRAELEQGFTPTSSSGGQIQIFNIEAYCKLCNKEFCNKYFLKTHMANKHGIYSDGGSGGSASGSGGGAVPGGPRFEPGAGSLSLQPSSRELYDKSPRFPGSGSAPPVSISGSFMAMSSPGAKAGDPKDPGSDPRSPLPSPHRPHSSEAATPTSSQLSPGPKPGPPPLIPGPRPASRLEENGDKEALSVEDLKRMGQGLDMTTLPSGIRLPMVPSMSPFGGPMHFDNLLKMNPLSPMDPIRKESDVENDFDKNKRPIPNVPSLTKGPEGGAAAGQKGSMTPDRLRQMGVINADAFCEFCCKEFCNKYFLRVHKLKKHGVCSPELPPEKVQKILQQMAKEAGKTGQPMPPLTMGAPSAARPPGAAMSEPPRSISGGPLGPMGGPFSSMSALGSMAAAAGPLNLIRPPHLPNFLNLPPLEGAGDRERQGAATREDSHSSCSSERPDEREEGKPINFSSSPRSIIEPECELKIDENAPVLKSPQTKDPEDQAESSDDQEPPAQIVGGPEGGAAERGGDEASEGLANLQNMIMKLNNTKAKPQDSATVCRVCNKDMENKYFLHAHMMNEHGMLHVEDDSKSPIPVSLPQYPADLSKIGEKQQAGFGGGQALTIPNPMISRPPPLHSLANGFPKLSDKPMNIFEQMQGLPRPSFLEQMKKDLGGSAGIDIPLSPMKRPSLDRDPNKKPASLSRSYCEICKKELCNKYFMKTHMMKMHGIMMEDGPPKGAVPCEICKKELSSKYFLKVHMAHEHGLGEDGAPMPPMFPGMSEFPAPPPLGEFSRLLMQQGEKNLERQKELERQRREEREAREEAGQGAGHICSLCSHTFPDIIALQVHIIKSHGALPPTTGLDGLFSKEKGREQEQEEEKEREDIAEEEEKQGPEEEERAASASPLPLPPNAMFPFPLVPGLQEGQGEASKGLQELLQRQLQFPGIINPLMGMGLPALAGAGAGAGAGAAPNQQFQGLFNMFLSEMLRKVQKDTPPQTPPSSPPPPPQEEPCAETQEATS